MLSGQAQVNLGECWLIRGAGRQRYSQPPFTMLLSLHQFVPTRGKSGYSHHKKIIMWPKQFAVCYDKSDPVMFLYRLAV